MSCN
jgi:hypothetical protein